MSIELYTIGHSTHPMRDFAALLGTHGIGLLCDVRSVPWSRFNPQFRREPLAGALAAVGIEYRYLGAELGARSPDPACHADGRVDYGRLARLPAFRRGLEAVRGHAARRRVALMCAERDPLRCHRALLVCRHLREPGLCIGHILGDGTLESHARLEQRMLDAARLPRADLLSGIDDRLERAYELLGARMAPAARPRPRHAAAREARPGRREPAP